MTCFWGLSMPCMYHFIHLVALICISDDQWCCYLFQCIYWSFVDLLWRNVFKSLAHFKIGLLVFFVELSMTFLIFWIFNLYQISELYICLPLLWGVFFHYLDNFLDAQIENVFFEEVLFTCFLFVACTFGVIPKNPFPNSSSWRCTLCCIHL